MPGVTEYHEHKCRCARCAKQDEQLERKEPRKKIPRAVMEEWKERKAKEEYHEQLAGVFVVQCTKCNHHVKVKVGPSIKCPRCLNTM